MVHLGIVYFNIMPNLKISEQMGVWYIEFLGKLFKRGKIVAYKKVTETPQPPPVPDVECCVLN